MDEGASWDDDGTSFHIKGSAAKHHFVGCCEECDAVAWASALCHRAGVLSTFTIGRLACGVKVDILGSLSLGNTENYGAERHNHYISFRPVS